MDVIDDAACIPFRPTCCDAHRFGDRNPHGHSCFHEKQHSYKGVVGLSTTIIVGGGIGIGRHLSQRYVDRGWTVVVTSRDEVRAKEVATDIGGDTTGLTVDLDAFPSAQIGPPIDTGVVDVVVCEARRPIG